MDFFRKFFGGGDTPSAKAAKERLRIVLIHDRTDISPQLLESLRVEMIAVLTKYMDIDESKIEMDLDHDESAVALVANIPVLRIKRGASDTLADDLTDAKIPPHTESLRNQNIRSRRRR
ncbi:MAG: cell division topological specificity factor MinE [Synergistaceae bacterium]|nr:cell division topological specificity factor MinE [Synergistaceae bacterium]